MTRRKVRYRIDDDGYDPNIPDDICNFSHHGYLLSFSTAGSPHSTCFEQIAIVEDIKSGRVLSMNIGYIKFVEEPYSVIVRFRINSDFDIPIIHADFMNWGVNHDNQSIAIVKITQDYPTIGFVKGHIIECRPHELQFLP